MLKSSSKLETDNVPIVRLGKWIHEIADGLCTRVRWKHRPEPFHRQQTVLHHTLEALLLAKTILDLQLRFKRPVDSEVNSYQVLSMVLLHDLSELHLDDLIRTIKQQGKIRSLYEELEREIFFFMADQLGPELSVGHRQTIDILDNRNSIEYQLFDAIEKLGYMLDGYEAIESGKGVYVDVIIAHWNDVEEYAKKFVGIEMVLDTYRDKFKATVSTQHPDLLRKDQMSLPIQLPR